MKALKINTDGTFEALESADEFVGYSTLSDGVGGMIEAVTLSDTLTLWVNEEGKLNGLPVNVFATALFTSVFGSVDIIVGDAVLTGGADDEGETLGLSGENLAFLEMVKA
jgi:hypothetical protein